MIIFGSEAVRYLSVKEISKKWGISERSVRGYCAKERIDGVLLTGKTWNIPESALKPLDTNKRMDTLKTF